MVRWWGLAVLATVLFAALLASGVVARPKRVLRVGLPMPIGSLHPLRRRDPLSAAEYLVFPGLARCAQDQPPAGGLAERVSRTAEGLEATLREDARFADGRPVEAADVVATLRALSPEALRSWLGEPRIRVEAIGPRTVRLAVPPGAPGVDGVLEYGIAPAGGDREVGAGAYRLVEETDERTVLERTAGGDGYARIELQGYASTAELWKRLLAGELDMAMLLDGGGHERLRQYPWIRRWATPLQRSVMLRWPPGGAPAPALRQAISLAIDRTRLATGSGEAVAWPGLPSRADARAARQALEAAGLASPELRLAVAHELSQFAATARLLAQYLAQAGIRVASRDIAIGELGRFVNGDAELTADIVPGPDDVPLYRMVAYGAAGPSVCGIVESACTPLAFLDRTYPCEAQRP